MSLFSWFSQKQNFAIKRDDKSAIKKELATFNKNTMWPVAQVREEVVHSQQTYVNTLNEQQAEQQNEQLGEKPSEQAIKSIAPTLPPQAHL